MYVYNLYSTSMDPLITFKSKGSLYASLRWLFETCNMLTVRDVLINSGAIHRIAMGACINEFKVFVSRNVCEELWRPYQKNAIRGISLFSFLCGYDRDKWPSPKFVHDKIDMSWTVIGMHIADILDYIPYESINTILYSNFVHHHDRYAHHNIITLVIEKFPASTEIGGRSPGRAAILNKLAGFDAFRAAVVDFPEIGHFVDLIAFNDCYYTRDETWYIQIKSYLEEPVERPPLTVKSCDRTL